MPFVLADVSKRPAQRSYPDKHGVQFERLPGGQLITCEQPEALAAVILKFERGIFTRRSPP